MLGAALSVAIALVVVKISFWLYRWANPNCSGKLPPGSMGFPVIGETIEFFKPYSFDKIQPFVKKRMSKYGDSLFRTNILGSKTIVSTDPEVNFEIFKQENRCFIMSYPEGIARIFGKDNVFFKEGKDFHKYIRQIFLHLVGSESLKLRFIHKIDEATREHLKSESFQGVLDVKDTTARLILQQMIQMMISDIKPETKSKLLENFRNLSLDLFRSPFDLSFWKTLYKGLLARRSVMKMLKRMFKERRKEAKSSEIRHGDFMERLVEEVEKEEETLNEERSLELILSLLMVSSESTSGLAAITVKFIAENPKVLMELKVTYLLRQFLNAAEAIEMLKGKTMLNRESMRTSFKTELIKSVELLGKNTRHFQTLGFIFPRCHLLKYLRIFHSLKL